MLSIVTKKIKKIFFCFFLFFCCKNESEKMISNTLEIALNKRYCFYSNTLESANQKDSIALVDFLKIDYIYDAAGYDHGYILYQLMQKCGDKNFSNALKKITQKELWQVRLYIEAGLDARDGEIKRMIMYYPISSRFLNFKF